MRSWLLSNWPPLAASAGAAVALWAGAAVALWAAAGLLGVGR